MTRTHRTVWPLAVLLVAVLGFSVPVSAQGFGVIGGLNYTSVDDVTYQNARATFENRSGYHLGVYLDLPLGPLAVRPGVRYLHAGPIYEGIGDVVEGSGDSFVRDDFDVSFVSVPVDASLSLPLPIIDPYAFAGPEFRFQRAPDAPPELTAELEDWSYIGNLGLGAEISLPGSGVTLRPEIRYSFGLSGLIDEEITLAGQTFTATDQRRSESFFISLGIEP